MISRMIEKKTGDWAKVPQVYISFTGNDFWANQTCSDRPPFILLCFIGSACRPSEQVSTRFASWFYIIYRGYDTVSCDLHAHCIQSPVFRFTMLARCQQYQHIKGVHQLSLDHSSQQHTTNILQLHLVVRVGALIQQKSKVASCVCAE